MGGVNGCNFLQYFLLQSREHPRLRLWEESDVFFKNTSDKRMFYLVKYDKWERW